MKIAIFGRTGMLLKSAEALLQAGHQISFVGTTKPSEFYEVGIEAYEFLAKRIGAAFREGGDINSEEYVNQIRSSGAEVGVSVNWPTLIKNQVIDSLKYGVLNAHAGDLPRYRGNACPNWAILVGEEKIGVCVHKMLPAELDNGPILGRRYLQLTSQTYIGDVYRWLEAAVPDLYLEVLAGMESGLIEKEVQSINSESWLRCYPRRPEDSRIDWKDDAVNISRLIRASSKPFHGAFAYLEDSKEIRIWRAEIFDHLGKFLAMPGQVLSKTIDGNPVIACGDGAVKLNVVTFTQDNSDAIPKILSSLRNRLT